MVLSVMPTYARYDLTFVRGDGAYVFDEKDDKDYRNMPDCPAQDDQDGKD